MRLYAGMAIALIGCANAEGETLTEAPPLAQAAAEASSAADSATTATATADAEPALPPPGTPIVDLGGVANLPPPATGDRIGIKLWLTRVRTQPDAQSKVLGFLRAGAVVARRGERLPGSKGCDGGWQGIEPAGFVCMDEATTDLDDPVLRASRAPDLGERLPYMYGTVTRGGPVYARIPTQEHLKTHEPHLAGHLKKWKKDDVSGARYGLDVWLRHTTHNVPGALEALEDKVTDDVPWFLEGGQRVPAVSAVVKREDDVKVDQVDRRQGRSFIHSFLHEGRRYNVTPDLTVIPADRFRPIRGSTFHGWQVDKELELPFAIMRRKGNKWRFDGKKRIDAGSADYRSVHLLTGKQKIYDKKLHYETKDGFWLDDRHASRIDPAKRWPKWAQQGAKWIDINLTKQVLVAYEGQTMVYATLVSTGEAGLADPDESTATIRGIYRIHTKYVTTTMDSDEVGEEFELRDVPYVQYFKDGYALHGAYWHDSFGRPKSHGCINLAPEDARRLFHWTDPPVPHGWHGARKALTGTIVFVHP